MKIKYYGAACNCKDFQEVLQNVCQELKIAESDLVISNDEVAAKKAGIPELPALVVNDQLLVSGYIPSAKKLSKFLKKYLN